MIVVDASALVAILSREDDWLDHLTAINDAAKCHLSPVSYLESGIVLIRRDLLRDQPAFDHWLTELDIIIRDDLLLSSGALAAYLRYGKGLHPARLNLSDCFSYALARALDLPLLYKGDDFAKTDVRSALQPT